MISQIEPFYKIANLDSTRKFLAFRSNKGSFYFILENSEKIRILNIIEVVKGSYH